MAARIYRINYKSDFILTLHSDAGWMTPFCIKFWTGAPSQAFYAQWDGTTYTHCSYNPSEPTKLTVQFDDHHLPIGDLKYQVAYHFTVEDFPNDTEDEVLNQADITTEIDGEEYHVMLDFTGETAPEIQFSLPAYANEVQRIANEQQRVINEQERITNEQARVLAEQARVNAESERVTEFNRLATQAENDHTRAVSDHTTATTDHTRAEQDHTRAGSDHSTSQTDHTQAESDHQTATTDHTRAEQDHTRAGSDHSTSQTDHTRAESDHATAVSDHTTAVSDHTQAESDHAATVALNTEVTAAEAQRQANEQARQQAEQQRVTRFETQMQTQQTAYEQAEANRESAFETAEARRDAEVDEKVADITNLQDNVAFINKSFGKYDGQREIVLSQAIANKYVDTNGDEVSANGYGISTPLSLNAGDILLIPSAQAVPASVSVVARMVQRTYQKIINYTYTYRTDYPELPATATADYDSTLVYTAVYDETGETPTLTGWTMGGETYTTLPVTHEVSEQFYEPLVKQAVSAMPSTGYYIYLCPTAMTVVVSGLTATVDGGTALVVGWGIFKNITTNFVGAPGQSVLAQAFAVLFAAIDGLRAQLDDLGETKAKCIDFADLPKVCGQPLVVEGEGAPVEVPQFVGQRFHDTTNKKVYEAFSVTNAVADWILLN